MNETVAVNVYGAEQWIPYLMEGGAIPALAIIMGGLLLMVVVSGVLMLGFVKILRDGGSTKRVRLLEAQERATFKDLQRGFKRMEERIDSLELLLVGPSSDRNAYQHDID